MDSDKQKRYGTRRSDAGTRSRRTSSARQTSDQRPQVEARGSSVRPTRERPAGERSSSTRRHTADAGNPYLADSSSSKRTTSPRRSSRPSSDAAKKAGRAVGNVARSVGDVGKGLASRASSGFGALTSRFPLHYVLGAAAVLVLALVLGINHLTRIRVTVNDQPVTVSSWSTVQRLLDRDIVTPVPGDLLAVDGSVITEGGGDVASVTINGEAATVTTKLSRGDVVTIGDGADVTEEYTSTEEPIAHGSSSDEALFENYWNGSIHLLSDGQDGVRTTRTGSVSGKTVTEVTTPAIDAGFHIYTANVGEDKVIALTFDDGPWPETTDAILDILEQYGAHATFFTIGNQIAEHPDQVKRAIELGCQVCTHTWDHAAGSGGGVNICYMSAEEQVNEIQQGYKAIADVTGSEPPHYFRAPGGNFYGEAVTNLWPYVDAEIGWDVDTEDWRQPGSDYIAQMILSAKPGQVILMHDGGGDRWQTVEGLKQAIPQLVEQGYTFVTIEELLAYGAPTEQADA
ncbi:MAG: polysaccharide deacetylase family protein [Atopobiaceae bacterium]|nr:polysaccharide deacetylase family protein [Atopobiaceae bacterium]MBQ6410398.1 polysaccharide deacetylase family protein [Atopobiaceae bacterium]MBQ6650903.1 polysaccharide deacetylase family protein [Atopobiaceae bacterium]